MPTGTIARLLIDKGFGFIRDEGGIEHFFHAVVLVDDRVDKQRLERGRF